MSDPDSRQPARVFTVSADLSSLMRGYTRHGRSSILIPFELKARIEREAQEARARELKDIRGSTPPPKEPHWSRTGTPPAAAPDPASDPAQGAATAPPKVPATAPTPPSTRSRDLDYEAERARLLHLSQAWLELNPETQMRVYEDLAPLTLIKRYGPPASEDRQRNADIFRVLASKGPVRHRAQGAEDLKDLDTLARAQPHLREVVEFVRSQIQLARASQSGLYLPPILLVGPPGVGKTHFAQELAATLDIPVHLQAMDTDVTNAVFLGSDKKWSNSHMGVLFELIGMGTHANPMIILDELDKASKHHSGVTATQSLHSLLEPVSAGRVRDISLDIEFNASAVFWVATANDPDRIAAPLRSRFKEFRIEQPGAADAIEMAQAMVSRLVPVLAPEDFQIPPRSLVVLLAHLSAREIYQVLREAIARAVVKERLNLVLADLPAEIRGDEVGKGWLH